MKQKSRISPSLMPEQMDDGANFLKWGNLQEEKVFGGNEQFVFQDVNFGMSSRYLSGNFELEVGYVSVVFRG